MSRKHHDLKCETEYFQAIEKGLKRFEWRKNDRDFQKYDTVTFVEVAVGYPTGRKLGPFEINYLLCGIVLGIPEGYFPFQFQ